MKTRIGVVGIGGVGGYFGGLLAARYKASNNVEIIFITRPLSENLIKEKGLKLITPEEEQIVFPAVVASNSKDIGILDVLIVAVKSYDLVNSITNISDSINDQTIILPLLNGIDAKVKIEQLYPNNLVLDGCVFVISKVVEQGVIKRIAGKGMLFFGSSKEDKRLEKLQETFIDAGINSKYAPNILEIVWGKFLFISSLASLTSYSDLTTGQLFESEVHKKMLFQLMSEFKEVADAKNIPLSKTIIEDTISKIKALPYETTTSMQRDYQDNKKTEYQSLTKYLVDLAEELAISVPNFQLILTELEKRENNNH